MNWLKKIAFKWGLKYMRNRLHDYEEQNPDISQFRTALYTMAMPDFTKYCIEKLSEKSGVESYMTFPEYCMKLTDPLPDKYENVIDMLIDEMGK